MKAAKIFLNCVKFNNLKMKKTLLFVALGLLTLASCKKKGCIDANAFNYDVTAGKDDGSCTYHATGVFYYSQDTYLDKMVSPPIAQLEYYIDDVLIGTGNSDDGWIATSDPIPTCSTVGFQWIDVDMGSQLQKLHTYEVKNAADGTTIPGFTGSMVFIGGTCHAVELQ
jgi:hypothetical protein